MTDFTKPQYEHGFWWWYDATRRGWFIGCAPSFGRPSWASSQSGMAYTALSNTQMSSSQSNKHAQP